MPLLFEQKQENFVLKVGVQLSLELYVKRTRQVVVDVHYNRLELNKNTQKYSNENHKSFFDPLSADVQHSGHDTKVISVSTFSC